MIHKSVVEVVPVLRDELTFAKVIRVFKSKVIRVYKSKVIRVYKSKVIRVYKSKVIRVYKSKGIRVYKSKVIRVYKSKVIRVYKSTAKDEFPNYILYQPILLLPSISRILRKVVHRRTYDFVQGNNPLNNDQHGFREKHSTINAMTTLTSDVINLLEKRLSPQCFFI